MPCLVREGPEGQEVYDLGETTYIGRAPECDIVVHDASVSRRHARISRVHGQLVLSDEGSRYGCVVNGTKVTNSALNEGDRIRLGNLEFLYFEDRAMVDAASGAIAAIGGFGDPAGTSGEELGKTVQQLQSRLEGMSATLKRTETLLGLHNTFIKCTSIGMVVQGAGPEVFRTLKAERGVILLFDANSGSFARYYAQQLEGIPEHRVPEADLAFGESRVRHSAPDSEQRVALMLPIPGGEQYPLGIVYADLPPGRTPDSTAVDLATEMVREIGNALNHLGVLQKLRQEAEARNNLARYLSDQLVDEVLAGRIALELGGEQRRVTVLFTDIRSFTTLSEKMPPDHVLALLNEYFTETVPIVQKYSGSVDKFIGDALMAVFGAPVPLEDQADRAVRAALDIRRRAMELRHEWRDRPWARTLDISKFSIGIGVNTGRAVAGNLGTTKRQEYAVIGDAVNVASRLCSAAGPGQIYIGNDTARGLGSTIRLTALEPMQVKGRVQPVQAYEVLDASLPS